MSRISKREADGKNDYQRWYDKNKEDFNARRREKYAQSKEYRDKQITQVHAYRDKRVMPASEHRALIDGHKRKVYTKSQAIEFSGMDPDLFLLLEHNGMIPSPSIAGDFALYTRRQLTLLLLIASRMDSDTLDVNMRGRTVKQYVADMWEVF